MDDKKIQELINKALNEDIALPAGLSERLEEHIDLLANPKNQMTPEKKVEQRLFSRKRSLLWLSGVAATLLCAILFTFTELNRPDPKLVDTFDDPKEAAIAAENALALLSSNLNKGLSQVNEAGQEMNKINKIVNKHLND